MSTLGHIQTVEYYLVLNSSSTSKNLWTREKAWRKRKCLFLSERGQSEKASTDGCMLPTPAKRHSGKGKTVETLKTPVVGKGQR